MDVSVLNFDGCIGLEIKNYNRINGQSIIILRLNGQSTCLS
jgi:hypothetical protein